MLAHGFTWDPIGFYDYRAAVLGALTGSMIGLAPGESLPGYTWVHADRDDRCCHMLPCVKMCQAFYQT